jgi:hypothetical protein
MGVERAVTRWYLQRQCILDEITALQTALEQTSSPVAHEDGLASAAEQKNTPVEQQLIRAQKKLRILGPCPKPMMG